MFNNRTVRLYIVLFPLITAILACAVPGTSQPTADPLSIIPPEEVTLTGPSEADLIATENAAPRSTDIPATPIPEYAYLDPCTLVTAEEAAAILGEPVFPDPFGVDRDFGGCQHNTDGQGKVLYVAAGYGGEAKGMLLLGIGMLSGISDDAAVDDYYNDLLNRSPDMSLLDLFNDLNTNLPVEDDTPMQPVSGLGDSAYYRWDAEESEAELQFVTGEKYVLLRIEGMPEETARPHLDTLAQQVLSRLPDGFRTLNPPDEE